MMEFVGVMEVGHCAMVKDKDASSKHIDAAQLKVDECVISMRSFKFDVV